MLGNACLFHACVQFQMVKCEPAYVSQTGGGENGGLSGVGTIALLTESSLSSSHNSAFFSFFYFISYSNGCCCMLLCSNYLLPCFKLAFHCCKAK